MTSPESQRRANKYRSRAGAAPRRHLVRALRPDAAAAKGSEPVAEGPEQAKRVEGKGESEAQSPEALPAHADGVRPQPLSEFRTLSNTKSHHLTPNHSNIYISAVALRRSEAKDPEHAASREPRDKLGALSLPKRPVESVEGQVRVSIAGGAVCAGGWGTAAT
jgi:hypothetical protein